MKECECFATCDLCGSRYLKELPKCDRRVHRYDAEVQRALQQGYWKTDSYTGRLYKTRAVDIRVIYQSLDKGQVWFSRKEFNDAARGVMVTK